MEEKKISGYECHVFICTNQKAPGKECCAQKNASELRDQLKAWAKEKYGKRVRINNSGCLDCCSKGIAAVIYPAAEWHIQLKSTDLEELKHAIDNQLSKPTSH